MAKLPKKDKKEEAPEVEETEAAEETEAEGEGEDLSHRTSKDEIATKIAELFSEYAGKRAGAKTMAVRATNQIYQQIFDSVLRDGYFRFPHGLGALKVTDVKGGPRTVPRSGARIMTADRKKIVYQMGKNVRAVLNDGVPDSYYIDDDGNKIDPPAKKSDADKK